MEATLPRWAALVVGTGTRCLILAIVVFLLVTIMARFALSARDLTARYRIITGTQWALVIAALAPVVVLTVAVRAAVLRGLAERLGDAAIGVVACLMAVHLLAVLVVMAGVLRTRASWNGGCRAQWSRGLVFVTHGQWRRFRSAVTSQWTAMAVVLLLGLLLVGATGYGVLWPQRRIAFACWAGLDIFAWIVCLAGIGVLGDLTKPTGSGQVRGPGEVRPGEVLEQRRES